MEACRCGHPKDAVTPHPCHWRSPGGRCGSPATQRFYNARPVCLSGVHMKLAVDETWACDEHWQVFLKMLADRDAVKTPADQG